MENLLVMDVIVMTVTNTQPPVELAWITHKKNLLSSDKYLRLAIKKSVQRPWQEQKVNSYTTYKRRLYTLDDALKCVYNK